MKLIPIEERLIVSMYDFTGAWAQPYINAGYPVILWDKQLEGDVLSDRFYTEVVHTYGDNVYGLITAPPCTDFAGSGARWWEEKDKDIERINLSCALIEWVLHLATEKAYFPNLHFWALENPVGRLERLVPEIKPYRKLVFNPSDYGDPYTKKTILYGNFNSSLPKLPVLNLFGSEMHMIPPSPQRQALRSATPKGFSQAFFKANK